MSDPTTPPAHLEVDEHAPDRNPALELVGVTEAAAMAAVMAVSSRHSMYDPSAVFSMEKLVVGPEAADVVDIRRVAKAKGTHSLVMRSRSGTIRSIESEHQLSKLRAYSAIDFDHAR